MWFDKLEQSNYITWTGTQRIHGITMLKLIVNNRIKGDMLC